MYLPIFSDVTALAQLGWMPHVSWLMSRLSVSGPDFLCTHGLQHKWATARFSAEMKSRIVIR